MKVSENVTGLRPGRPLELMRAGDGDPRHGTVNGYGNQLCRCQACTAANTEYRRELRQRKRQALGVA